jgi:signal recognition particle subunit SEC65
MPSHFYVYPSYLKKGHSRAEGRRVPREEAVPGEVSAEDLAAACRNLGVEAAVEEHHYPREPWRLEGRVKVTKKEGLRKEAFLKALSKELLLHPPAARSRRE